MSRANVLRHAATSSRVLLGLTFLVFGLNGFLNFLPKPTNMPEGAAAFAGALVKTGYMFPLLKGVEVASGALLLSNRFVPLALALLAPIVVNIVAFHAFLEPSGMPIAGLVLMLEIFLAWSYRDLFRPMLSARTSITPLAPSEAHMGHAAGAHT